MPANQTGPYDWFIVEQGIAPNPTWGAGGGVGVQAANEDFAIAFGAKTTRNRPCVIRSITLLQSHGTNGVIQVLAGDGATVLFSLVIGANHNSPGHPLDLQCPNGFAIKDTLGVPTGSILVAYELLGVSAQAPTEPAFTSFTPSSDSRIVYVSSAGSDANNGLAPVQSGSGVGPKLTIAAGKALLRAGFPDWLLLRRGDTFTAQVIGQLLVSGRSLAEPQLIGAYGAGARPRVLTGVSSAVVTNGGGGSAATIDHIAIVGLEFFPHTYAGVLSVAGVELLLPGTNLLIEDCYIHGYTTNVVLTGATTGIVNARLRRNVIADAFGIHASAGNACNGLYAFNNNGLLLEENTFDHNGWHESIVGAEANIFSHNCYIDNGNRSVLVRRNVISNGASHGCQLRCGGVAEGNLFLRNAYSLSLGGGNIPEAGGVKISVLNNAFCEARDIDGSTPRGAALYLSNIASGLIKGNVAVNSDPSTDPHMIVLAGNDTGDLSEVEDIKNLRIEGNKFIDWGGSIIVDGVGGTKIVNIKLYDNDIQDRQTPSWPLVNHETASSPAQFQSKGNRFHSLSAANAWFEINGAGQTLAQWKTATGDVTSAAANLNRTPTLGISVDAFVTGARAQSAASWNPNFTASAGYMALTRLDR